MHVVVIGASVAGVTVAETLRSAGHDGPVTLVGAEPHAPYARPPLSKQVLDGTWDTDRTALRTADELRDLDVALRTGSTASALDTGRHLVLIDGAPVPYDVLVIATGVEAVRPDVHTDRPVHVLRTLDDAVALRAAWTAARHVAVLGSGVLASEIASAARRADRDVTIVGRSGRLTLGTVGPLLTDRLADLHTRNGVRLQLDAGTRPPERLVPSRADVVVAAIGGRPRTDWLAGSGLVLDDGVVCDAAGRAGADVWAVGDVARWAVPRTGRSVRVEHQTNAIEQAVAVATTIAGSTTAATPTPFFWSEVHGVRIQAAGVFDHGRPLDDDGRGLLRQDAGVVGWGAPRAFRSARATLGSAPPALV